MNVPYYILCGYSEFLYSSPNVVKQRSTFASHLTYRLYGDVDVDAENGSESTVNILLPLLPLFLKMQKLTLTVSVNEPEVLQNK